MPKERPGVGLGAVIFRGDDVLMIRRGKPPRMGQWAIPGGRQELGETVAEGAAREVLEETAIHCRIVGLVDVVDGIARAEDGSLIYHYTLIDLWGEWLAGEPEAGTDALDATWLSPDALATIELWAETRRVIDLARQKREAQGD